MTGGNLPVLYRNVLDGLPNDYAREVFLWAVDKFPNDRGAYKAEAFARRAAEVMPQASGLINLANWVKAQNGWRAMNAEQEADLNRFMAQRLANFMTEGNVKTDMPLPSEEGAE